MAESRTDRTPYLGLLALMLASADTDGWAYPYWNPQQIDAALYRLAQAPRTGIVPLNAPAVAPTLALLESGGILQGGLDLEIVQTFLDEYGGETEAGAVGSISTGAGITDPATAPTLGTPTSEATGYSGGPLIVVFTWVDELGGESLASPAATINLPYLAGGLFSQLDVTLPSTPAAAGAEQAWVYIQHRGGNVVLAQKITNPDEDTVTLDGTTTNCYLTPPYANTTGCVKSIQITGQTDAAADKTRFYIRQAGQSWVSADRRLSVSGVTEWDVDTVTYPLIYTGETLAGGWPPTISQVKDLRPIDLTSEVSGVLAKEHLEASGVEIREVEFTGSVGDWAAALATPGDQHGSLTILVPTYEGQRVMNQAILYWWNEMLDTPAWQIMSPFLPSEPWAKTPYGAYEQFPGTAWLSQEREGGPYMIHVEHPGDVWTEMPANLWHMRGMGDYLGFMGVYDDLTALEDEWGEPWNSWYVLAYVIATDSWYRYVGDTESSSAGGTSSPSTNLSGGSDCNFKLAIDGEAAQTVTLTGLTGLTTGSLIAQEIMRAMNALGGKCQYLTCSWTGTRYMIYGPSRDGVTLVVTDGDTLNVADDLKLGVANGGTETTGIGGWVKNPSSAMRGTFANVAALPAAADDGDTAFVLDQGDAVPGLMEYQTNAWVEVGKMTAP